MSACACGGEILNIGVKELFKPLQNLTQTISERFLP